MVVKAVLVGADGLGWLSREALASASFACVKAATASSVHTSCCAGPLEPESRAFSGCKVEGRNDDKN